MNEITETSELHLSRSALKNNVSFIRELIGNEREFVSVVKGNAYGHEIKTFVPLAYRCGVKSFAVFSTYEASLVLETEIKFKRLIIMGAIAENELEWIIQQGIEFFVFDFTRLEGAIRTAKTLGTKAKVHVEIETGFNRTGFVQKDWERLAELLKKESGYLFLKGICTHLAGAEDISNYLRIKRQITGFAKARTFFTKRNVTFEKAHAACSAAIINYPKTMLNMVRVGIMQYGYWPSREVKMAYLAKIKNREDPLKRVISWKSRVMNVRTVKEGEYIGYGRSFLSESELKVAIVPVGYAHGFSRSLSNLGKALINGVRVSVIGTVNMNMILIDVTNVAKIAQGDEVVLIGTQEDHTLSVASFSDLSDQLNYELLTRLSHSIPRKVCK